MLGGALLVAQQTPFNLECMAATEPTLMTGPLSAVCCPGHPDWHSSTCRGPAASYQGNEPCSHQEAGSGRASSRSQVSCTATAKECQGAGVFGNCSSTGCSCLWPELPGKGNRSASKGSRGGCKASPDAKPSSYLRSRNCSAQEVL